MVVISYEFTTLYKFDIFNIFWLLARLPNKSVKLAGNKNY